MRTRVCLFCPDDEVNIYYVSKQQQKEKLSREAERKVMGVDMTKNPKGKEKDNQMKVHDEREN